MKGCKNYEDTLIAVHHDHLRTGLPISYFLVDSFWYQELDRHVLVYAVAGLMILPCRASGTEKDTTAACGCGKTPRRLSAIPFLAILRTRA